jgi:dolichyl-phosphate-mannose-protein mannosyltransferase
LTARAEGRSVWAIFVLALVLRLAWIATQDERLAWPDEHEYAAIGRHLAAGDGFVATSYRNAPVLPAYLGAVFRVFGERYAAARAGQALLGAATCVVVARTAALLVSPAVGVLSGLLLAVYPAHVYLAGVFYTTCLETFLCAWCVHLAARVLQGRGGTTTAAAAGVVVGLAVLTRPVFVVLGPCVALAFILARALRGRRAVVACLALGLGAAVTVLPWTLRNRAVYGRFLLVSSGGGITLWKGNNELADGGPDDRFLGWGRPVWRTRLEGLDAGARAALEAKYAGVEARVAEREREVGDYYLAMDDVLAPVARAYVAAEPGRALARAGRKVLTFFSAFSRTAENVLSPRTALVAALTFYPLLALAVLGAALAVPRGAGLVLPGLVVAAMTGVHALLTSCTRYRLPVDPYVIMAAAFAVVELAGRRAARTP